MDAKSLEASTGQVQEYLDLIVDLVVQYTPTLVMSVAVLIIGLWVIKRLNRVLSRAMDKGQTDPTLATFLQNLSSVIMKALLFISVASMIGIETTSFIAILGAAGLAIGLALQGSLANFAGGVLVLMFRPFKVGDFVEAQGVAGTVAEIQIFNTVLKTGDNRTVIVPNGAISNGIITNFSAQDTRRVDFVFGIGYDDDIPQARAVLLGILGRDERVLDGPEPFVKVGELGDSSVNFTCRVWVKAADYWGVYFDTIEQVKTTFDAENIAIPYPQTDVHLHQAP